MLLTMVPFSLGTKQCQTLNEADQVHSDFNHVYKRLYCCEKEMLKL